VATDAKTVDWAELEECAVDLRAWLQLALGMDAPPRTAAEVGASLNAVDGQTRTKADAAVVALLALDDFEARRIRAGIRDLESFRKWRRARGMPVRDEDARLLPMYETSDVEALLGELREGEHWAARLGKAIETYAAKTRVRGELVRMRGVRENQEAAIAGLEEFQAALVQDIEELQWMVSQDNSAVRYPLTVRGQNALLREIRANLKTAGFKPAELPKLLKQRRY